MASGPGLISSGQRPALIVLVISVVAMSGMIAYSLVMLWATHLQHHGAQLRSIARLLADAIDAELSVALRTTEMLSSGINKDQMGDLTAFEALAASLHELSGGWFVLIGPPPRYPILAVSNRSGAARVPAELTPENRAALSDVLASVFERSEATVSDMFLGAAVHEPIVTLMVPAELAQGRIAVSHSFRPTTIEALIRRQDLPERMVAAVVDGGDRVLAATTGRAACCGPDLVIPSNVAQQPELERKVVMANDTHGTTALITTQRPTLARRWTVVVAVPMARITADFWMLTLPLAAGGVGVTAAIGAFAWHARHRRLQAVKHEAAELRTRHSDVERLHRGMPVVVFMARSRPGRDLEVTFLCGDTDAVLGSPATKLPDALRLWERLDLTEQTRREAMGSLLRNGSHVLECRTQGHDGPWHWVRLSAQCINSGTSRHREIIGCVVNVDREHRARSQTTALARLSTLNAVTVEIAHQLRQPLGIMAIATENARADLESGDVDVALTRLDRIGRQIERADQAIRQIRRHATTEDVFTQRAFPVAPVIADALRLSRTELEKFEVAVRIVPCDSLPSAWGAPLLLEQALIQILLRLAWSSTNRATAGATLVIASDAANDGSIRVILTLKAMHLPRPRSAAVVPNGVAGRELSGVDLDFTRTLLSDIGGSLSVRNRHGTWEVDIKLASAPCPASSCEVV